MYLNKNIRFTLQNFKNHKEQKIYHYVTNRGQVGLKVGYKLTNFLNVKIPNTTFPKHFRNWSTMTDGKLAVKFY